MPLRFRSLRGRLLAVFFGLVLVVTSVGVTTVNLEVERNARRQLAFELSTSERVLRRLLADRTTQLEQAARVLAADFAFRAAVATGERDTVVSALANHGERIGAALMMIIDRDGEVTASTAAELPAGARFPQPDLFARARAADRGADLMVLDGRLYQTVLMPVKAPTTIAWVAISFIVDAHMAEELGALTSTTIAFAVGSRDGRWHFVGEPGAPAARPALERHLAGPATGARHALEIDTDLLLATNLTREPVPVFAVLHVPVDSALAPYAPLQRFLFALALGALCATALGGALIARGVTRPLSQLADVAREIADGDYSHPVDIERDDEVGALATALNAMRDGIASREATIRDLAYRDAVTGLPNRAAFSESATTRFAQLSAGEAAAVLVIGIDNFRYVTQTLGHHFADRLLREVALRLAATHGHASLARIGNDQFAVFVERAAQAGAAGLALVQALESPFRVDDQIVDLGGSVGLVEHPLHGADVATLLQRAEIALGVARRTRNALVTYEPGFDQSPARLSLLGELRRAVEGNQLVLYYQPKLDLRSGEPAYVEALVRWIHPTRGFVPPDEFIPFAEQTGYIRVLTQWVVDAALRQCAAWQARGIGLRMCINVSARDLLSDDLPTRLAALLEELALDPGLVWLEITESAIMDDPVRAEQTIAALDALGLHLSIDDFGTGYSSLAYLKRLPVDELKIDKSFVLAMDRDENDATIVRSTIELGHNLGLSVVAEGVDSAASLAMLTDWGCEVAQGFHICRPLPPAELEAWLASEACRRFRRRPARPATPVSAAVPDLADAVH